MMKVFLLTSFAIFTGCTDAGGYNSAYNKPTPKTPTQKANANQEAVAKAAATATPSPAASATANATPPQTSNPGDPFQTCKENDVASANQPITAKVFKLKSGAESLAKEFANGIYATKICMTHFDVPVRDFTNGFPGIPNLFEWFAIDARAKLVVGTAGQHNFRLHSDDGAILFIDGKLIIDNDGQHPASSKQGSATLSAGSHDLRSQYFQGPATEIALQLFWTPPGKAEEIVKPANFAPAPF
jgi:hypothetical protein